MSRISITDFAFLLTETADSPRHVASLQIFRPPEGYKGDFVGDLMAALKTRPVYAPFNQKLKLSVTGMAEWTPDERFDIDYHMRRSALPAPGRRTQLAELASRLHSFMLDRNRPLWEMHFIDGLRDGCFGVYTKIHHAYCDGATLTRMANASFSADPQCKAITAFWEMGKGEAVAHPDRDLRSALKGVAGNVRSLFTMAKELGSVAGKMALDRVGLAESGLDVPFTSPRTALNGQLTRARRFAGVSLELERLRSVARTTGTTLNDVVVTVCDIALRRYLSTHAESPREPLVAELPVNLRREGEGSVTNIIGIIPVRMAGVSRSPVKRLKEVHRSTGDMKDALSSLSRETVMAYTLIIQGAAVAADLFNLSNYFRPHGNILISNLPGSPVPLYLLGARLVEIYPISTIPPHMVMNITVFSYDGKLFFGLIGGYDAIPNLPEMPRYLLEAFEELEAEAGGSRAEPEPAGKPARVRKPRAPRAPARKSTAPRAAGKPRKKSTSGKSASTKDGG
jgi:WS/DGAT/MGAT family acyltransferase